MVFGIFSPLLDSLSWSLLEFSPTGKAETFLCNHALFIHLVIKRGQTLKLHRSFRKTPSPLHLKVRKCPQTEIYEWQLWRLKPIHKHLNGQNTNKTHNRYLFVPMSLTKKHCMCVFTCPFWLIDLYDQLVHTTKLSSFITLLMRGSLMMDLWSENV